jgi:hypothetical protein
VHPRIAAAEELVAEEAENRRVREFRRPADPSVDGIQEAQERVAHASQIVGADLAAGAGRSLLGEMRHERLPLFEQLFALRPPGVFDRVQDLHERRTAKTRRRRPISAAVDGRSVGRQEHRQRPAALFAQRMQRRHVMVVDVGPLLAIDLDVDEPGVHPSGGLRILERFMRHHMAPVASRVADRKENRLVFRARLIESGLAPGQPVHRIVGVLTKIRAFLVNQRVGHGAFSLPAAGVRSTGAWS